MDEEIEIEPDLPSMFPPIEVDMVVDDTPIVLNNDDNNVVLPKSLDDYKEEMLKNGLVDSDIEYFTRAYKNLEEVKFIKIHCTGCDKHMGSAPSEIENRYQHPLLKVLLCAKCFEFYCSGEFEKGEDGSELYCRWCGEGGLVYCCTKCPFVFCKNCITRNLGRGTARIIENTEYWVCFSCNPWQISRHRATYWAVQKFAEEMIARSKITGDVTQLDADANICCQGKKRAEPCEKSRLPASKKSKVVKMPFESALLENALQNNTPSTSKGKKSINLSSLWQTMPLASIEPEDEVICTPDIIPIDESPPSSPLLTTPAPLIPYIIQQQSVSKNLPQPPQQSFVGKGRIVPVNIKSLQKTVQASIQKHVFSPISLNPKQPSPVNLGKLNQEGLRIVHHPSSTLPSSPKPRVLVQNSDSKKSADTDNDWFDKAIFECAEVTEYLSTKISGLSGVHSRAHTSGRLMEELHNTLQTYIHVAIDKMRKIKRNMQVNFDKEVNKTERIVNPFAKNKPRIGEDSSSQDTQSASEEDDSYVPKEDDYSTQDTDSTVTSVKSKRKHKVNKNVPKLATSTTKIQRVLADEDVIFDMDVTNASDEEMEESRTASSAGSEAHFQTGEVINIISSDDDSDVEEVVVTSKEQDANKTDIDANTTDIDANKTDSEAKTDTETNKTDEANKKIEVTTDETSKETVEKTNEEKSDTPNDETNTTKEETPLTEKTTEEEKPQTDKTILKDKIEETPVSVENLIKKVATKYNIENISSEDLLKYLSAQVILYNNRRAQKEFAKTATSETKLRQFNVVETIEDILNPKWEQTDEENRETHNNTEIEEPCDVEEMLGSGVVLRAKKSFGDEFSRFIGKSNESECLNVLSCDEEEFSENEDISEANSLEPDQLDNEEMDKQDELDKEEKMDIQDKSDEDELDNQDNEEKMNVQDKSDDENKLDVQLDDEDKLDNEEKLDVQDKSDDETKLDVQLDDETKLDVQLDDENKLDNEEKMDVQDKSDDENKSDVQDKSDDETKLHVQDKLDQTQLDNEEKMDVQDTLAEEKLDDPNDLDENKLDGQNKSDDENKVEEPPASNNANTDKTSDDSDLEEAELFFNKDNESLSLPPDGIGDSITTNNIFATKETENSDLVLDSGILALKQMAENCVNPTVELRQASTECNG